MTKYKITLTTEERAAWSSWSLSARLRTQAYHARILLLADTFRGGNSPTKEMRRRAGPQHPTIARVRQRSSPRGSKRPSTTGPTTPARQVKIKGDVEQELIRVACSDPPQGRCRWTLCLLADELVALAWSPPSATRRCGRR